MCLVFINTLYCLILSMLIDCVWLFATPWTAAHQVSLSFTISWILPKFISIKLVDYSGMNKYMFLIHFTVNYVHNTVQDSGVHIVKKRLHYFRQKINIKHMAISIINPYWKQNCTELTKIAEYRFKKNMHSLKSGTWCKFYLKALKDKIYLSWIYN